MRSKFAIAGHPVHPALVALPIGLFSWSLVSLLIYLVSDDNMTWYDMSYYAAIGGIVTGLIAAVPGFGDLVTMALKNPATRAMSLAHMMLNLATVGLYAVVAFLMYDEGATDGGALTAIVALQLAGMGMLGVSGWLGGEMVFRHHIGVVPEAEHLPEEPRRPRPAIRADARRR